jgi:hypothetical protein
VPFVHNSAAPEGLEWTRREKLQLVETTSLKAQELEHSGAVQEHCLFSESIQRWAQANLLAILGFGLLSPK